MERLLNCIVIDDEPLARELLKSYVERTAGLRLDGCFESAAEAVKPVMSGEVDLVFLDINMPLLNGIEFGKMIPRRTRIIYITAYDTYALEGFRTNALDYLLKPVSYGEFLKAIGKALEWFSMREVYEMSQEKVSAPHTLTVKADHRLVQMKTDSILYIEVRKDRLIFFRNEGEDVSAVMSMRDIEALLPSSNFMRVHRSFIVNLHNVEVVERNRIIFGKSYIPISDSRRDEFLRRVGVSGR
ncbi:MAG: response regulator transcription factor [Bacteroidales bacterium]|nr:response regulator transcription factor [Bacteroidales bacterium]MBD5387635.1 response regulator transcription factor [bacterium]